MVKEDWVLWGPDSTQADRIVQTKWVGLGCLNLKPNVYTTSTKEGFACEKKIFVGLDACLITICLPYQIFSYHACICIGYSKTLCSVLAVSKKDPLSKFGVAPSMLQCIEIIAQKPK